MRFFLLAMNFLAIASSFPQDSSLRDMSIPEFLATKVDAQVPDNGTNHDMDNPNYKDTN